MDKELSHQVTDVVESHSIEQAGRKQKNLNVRWNTEQEKRPRRCWEGQSRQPHLGLWLSTTCLFCFTRWRIRVQAAAFCKEAPLTSLNTPSVLQPSVPATSDVGIMALPKAPHLKLTIWAPSQAAESQVCILSDQAEKATSKVHCSKRAQQKFRNERIIRGLKTSHRRQEWKDGDWLH